jgi:hypothetical protein
MISKPLAEFLPISSTVSPRSWSSTLQVSASGFMGQRRAYGLASREMSKRFEG